MPEQMKTPDEVIAMISNTLAEADGYFIEKIANMVLNERVTFKGAELSAMEEATFEVKD